MEFVKSIVSHRLGMRICMTAICEQPMIKISGIKIAEGIDAPSYPFPDKINMIS